MTEEHTAHVYQFLKNWALVIAMVVVGCIIIATALLVVGWPMIVASHFGYSDTEVLSGETIWSYVWLGWTFLLVTVGTALAITKDQVNRNE